MKLRYHFVGETVGWLVLLQGGTDIWAWPERPSQDLAVGSVPEACPSNPDSLATN
jgi:hypothetical protein